MSKTSLADCSELSLPKLETIARQTKLVIRESPKFCPDAFLQSLLSFVASGQGSGNQIASELKERIEIGMARQSMHDRFTTKSTTFLMAVICDLMTQRLEPAGKALKNGKKKSRIKRVFIEDASGVCMPKSNAGDFPAHGNHHGKTAGVKIDFAFDLLTGKILFHSLEQATTQDKTIGKEALSQVEIGDLVLRDMGYFCLSEFTAIEEMGAWWLTRLPLTTGVILGNGKALEARLRGRSQDVLDLEVIVGTLIDVRGEDHARHVFSTI